INHRRRIVARGSWSVDHSRCTCRPQRRLSKSAGDINEITMKLERFCKLNFVISLGLAMRINLLLTDLLGASDSHVEYLDKSSSIQPFVEMELTSEILKKVLN